MPDKNYLCFEAVESGIIKFIINGTLTNTPVIYYSINDGSTWTQYTFGTEINLQAGEKCYWKGDNNSFSESDSTRFITFTSTKNVKASGNVMSLLDSTCESVTIPNNYCFSKLFWSSKILTPPELPAINLKKGCYYYMFNDTLLTTIPENLLPSTTLALNCYIYMFAYSKVNTIPENLLPSTTLAPSCYSGMFQGCTNLVDIPENLLPSTTLAPSCYYSMFQECTNLKYIPKLPATTLTNECYRSMFKGCSILVVSTTETDLRKKKFRIPTTGTGVEGTNSLKDMFANIGGTFKGTPTINTTYYMLGKKVNYLVSTDEGCELTEESSPSGEYDEWTNILAQVTLDSGHTFDGWYENDTKVSSDNPYEFQITEDTSLVAKSEISYIDKVRLNEKEYNFRDMSLIQSNKINNVWYGTKSEYNSLETHLDTIEYNILEDE